MGDINSNAVGSGARYNAGKIPYELLPLQDITNWQNYASDYEELGQVEYPVGLAGDIIHDLGLFQAGSNENALNSALLCSVNYNPKLGGFADAARVFDYGRKKYAEWNWAKGMKWSIPLGCALRHCEKIQSGELIDQESGLPHIGHVQCNLLMLLTFARTYTQGDDRPVDYLTGHTH